MITSETTHPLHVSLGDMHFKKMIDQEEILSRIQAMAAAIDGWYKASDFELIVVLKGAFIFAADLVRWLKSDSVIHFVHLSSYTGTTSRGKVDVHLGYEGPVEGRSFLIVEDIVDTGRSICFLTDMLRKRGAADIRVVALLKKPAAHVEEVQVDMAGFDIGNEFVVGYGLDYDQAGRNLPHIYRSIPGPA
ncbi:MAG: hypoxanthine phosphoribosyltransferase [Flavobacteriales bacterium]|nr:hypoxanthine phosphoribosyltransferase [Flavobacteriales bacterium]